MAGSGTSRGMESRDDVLFAAACIMALLVFAGPLISFGVARSVIRHAPYLYLSTAFTSGLWIFYALDWGLITLWWLSLVGTLSGLVYVLWFLWRSDPADPRRTYLRRYARRGSPPFLCAVAFKYIVPQSTVYGILCCVAACAASAAPLYNAPGAFQVRSMDRMPSVFIPAFTLPNAVLSIIRNTTLEGGWNILDHNLVIASFVAGLCALGQLVMHVLFRRQPEVAQVHQEMELAQLQQEIELAQLQQEIEQARRQQEIEQARRQQEIEQARRQQEIDLADMVLQMQQLQLQGPDGPDDDDDDEDAPLLPGPQQP